MIELIWRLISRLQGFIKYGLVGSVGFGVHLLVLWILTDKINLWYMASATIAIVVAALNNYTLNYLWTFKDRKSYIGNKVLGYFKYLLSRGFTEGLYLGLLLIMVDIAGYHYMVSAVVVQVLTAVVGYVIAVRWIWRQKRGKRLNQTEVVITE